MFVVLSTIDPRIPNARTEHVGFSPTRQKAKTAAKVATAAANIAATMTTTTETITRQGEGVGGEGHARFNWVSAFVGWFGWLVVRLVGRSVGRWVLSAKKTSSSIA